MLGNQGIDLQKKIQNLELALHIERKKYNLVSEYASCGLWEYDIPNKRLVQSKKLDGRYAENDLIVENFRESILAWGTVHPDDLPIFDAYVNSMDRGEENILYEMRLLSDADEYIWVRYIGQTVFDKEHKPIRVLGKTLDITKEKSEIEDLMLQANTDSLTGCLNKQAIKKAVMTCISRYPNNNHNENNAMFIIDVDNFKKVNDRYGHLYGDYVLEKISSLIKNTFGKSDSLGRIGGDEFLVFSKGYTDIRRINVVAGQLIDALQETIFPKGENITISVGIAIYPKDGDSYEELFKKADQALYKAKHHGKNAYVIYNEELEDEILFGEVAQKSNRVDEDDIKLPTVSDFEQRLLDFALRILYDTTNGDKLISKILKESGQYYDFSQILIFESKDNYTKVKVTEYWNRKESSYFSDVFVCGEKDELSKLQERFRERTYAIIDAKDNDLILPAEEYLKEDMTCLQCGVFENNIPIAYIAFLKDKEGFKREEVNLFTKLTNMISVYLIRRINKDEVQMSNFFGNEILKNQKMESYAIDVNTHQLIYVTNNNNTFKKCAIGKVCYEAKGERKVCETCPIPYLKADENSHSVEYYSKENKAWLSSTVTRVQADDRQDLRLICTSDVTGFIERVRSVDQLTGIWTLEMFEARAMQLIVSEKKNYAIACFGFKRFSKINEERGYTIGDEVLRIFAQKLGQMSDENEMYCRIKGDDFLWLISCENQRMLEGRIKLIMKSASYMIKEAYPGINAYMTCGVYQIQPKDFSITYCIDNANIAKKTLDSHMIYLKNEYKIYEPYMSENQERMNRIENIMVESLTNNEFQPYVQPMVDAKTQEIVSIEVLARWFRKDGSIIPPDYFIPIFEKNGFVKELDFYIYRNAFRYARELMKKGGNLPTIAINVSRYHFADENFVERMVHLVERYEIPFSKVILELTESMFVDNLDRLLGVINRLRDVGFQIAVDDFGAGYSSLNLIKVLPIDVLKIDGDFFKGNKMTEKDKAIISTMIQLGKNLNLKIVCEGIETEEQEAFVRECNANVIQGFYHYESMNLQEFDKLYEERKAE